jgi:hypothetical protein
MPRKVKKKASTKISTQLASCLLFALHPPWPWRWRQYIPPNCWWTSTRLDDVTSQMTVVSIVNNKGTTNLNHWVLFQMTTMFISHLAFLISILPFHVTTGFSLIIVVICPSSFILSKTPLKGQ